MIEGLLPYLLDMLPASPVFMQASDSPEWDTEDVSFPFTEGCFAKFGEQAVSITKMVEKLGHVIDFEAAFGFFRLVQVNGIWLPQDLSIGIPGHSQKVNAEVLGAVASRGLMTGEILKRSMESNARLRESLAKFVAKMQGTEHDEGSLIVRMSGQDAETAPGHPARAVRFDGSRAVAGGLW